MPDPPPTLESVRMRFREWMHELEAMPYPAERVIIVPTDPATRDGRRLARG